MYWIKCELYVNNILFFFSSFVMSQKTVKVRSVYLQIFSPLKLTNKKKQISAEVINFIIKEITIKSTKGYIIAKK